MSRGLGAVLLASVFAGGVRAGELPAGYFRLMEAELAPLERQLAAQPQSPLASNPGAMLAASVLYAKRHPTNTSAGDAKRRELALRLGDAFAAHSEKDAAENRQDYEWEIHFWLDAYRLLEADLGSERRDRWRREIEKNIRWFAANVGARIDFPRYQSPFIRTSTNHYALWASAVYQAGKVLGNKEWEALAARAMHRLAAEEQTADGYWGEHTDNGPATGYNYLTLACVALYWELSQDPAALEALRRATDFHKNFTWPDGTPVEVTNGRNRHWGVSAWGHFGFSHWPDGRGYAAFLAGRFTPGKVSSRDLGRLSQSALYYHDGPAAPVPQEMARSAYRMRVPAGIRKTGPWVVALSGLIDVPIDSQFTLDRQGHVSVYHEKLGLIVSGANSKRQPELATFIERTKDQTTTIPLSSRLRMSDERDRLGLAYNTFFAEVDVAPPTAERVAWAVVVTEKSKGLLQNAQLNLQLCLKAGEQLETAAETITLGEQRIELGPERLGTWVRHRGWTLRLDPGARLTWPVYPFNPYSNAPETKLDHAVAAVAVPVRVVPPPASALPWRTQTLAFSLETADPRP